MPHYFDTGFVVRQPAWHGLATVLTEAPDIDAAIVLAGHDWEPELQPVFKRVRELVGITDNGDPHYDETFVEIEDAQATVRSDDGATLGVVGANYTPICNRTMWDFLEALAGEGATIETGGTLKGGCEVFATAYLDEPYTLPGDNSPSLPYVAITNSHDGSSAMRAMATQVRIVCANTVQAAHADSGSRGTYFEFRHTANVMDRVAEARAAIAGVRSDRDHWIELATELIGLPVSRANYAAFISEFIPEPTADVVSERVRNNIAEARSQFRLLYDAEQNGAHYGTGMALVNTAIEYLDHVRGWRNEDTLTRRQLLRPEPLKAKAVQIVREVCAV